MMLSRTVLTDRTPHTPERMARLGAHARKVFGARLWDVRYDWTAFTVTVEVKAGPNPQRDARRLAVLQEKWDGLPG